MADEQEQYNMPEEQKQYSIWLGSKKSVPLFPPMLKC
jgi:hypothetical protein